MYYLNQTEYPTVPYPHDLDHGGVPVGRGNVANAACGPCCACMVVNNLTFARLTLPEALRLSGEVGANRDVGTDLSILGPAVARCYGLTYANSYDIADALACLAAGGMAIANPGGDRDGRVGLFTHGGHYIVLVSAEDGELTILDPALSEARFAEEGRRGRVRISYPFVYAPVETVREECVRPWPSYHLFKRKK